tara:strand:+ start:1518 stop:2135 length:618 start_codon:yes stop_codon:yes gene_type:complete
MALISNGTSIFDNGSMATGLASSMVHIKKLTASNSGSLSFVHGSGGVDFSTHKEYLFTFNNIHPATNGSHFSFNLSIDGGSNYNVAKTTTAFRPFHYETASDTPELAYQAGSDLAQGTGFQNIAENLGSANDECSAGHLTLYNPSSTTFTKHFMSRINLNHSSSSPATVNWYISGYGNTTSDVDAVQFKMTSGNFDGVISLYGIA